VLLAFLTSSCLACRPWWSELATSVGQAVVIVTPDPTTESRDDVAALDRGRTPVIMSSAAWNGYRVVGSPTFVVIRDGLVESSGAAHSWAELDRLIAGADPARIW
jgi:hypothetical protein